MAETMTTQEWVPTDTFGARLALIRQHYGWNVSQAATACGINDQSWHNWEGGMSPRGMDRVARKIADATGCDYRWLIAGGPLRSRCFSPLPVAVGQLQLFDDHGGWSRRADLSLAS